MELVDTGDLKSPGLGRAGSSPALATKYDETSERMMEVGDLVKKRWGRTEVYQQNTAGIVVGKEVETRGLNPAFHGYWLVVLYPGSGHPAYRYRPNEFEVISESR